MCIIAVIPQNHALPSKEILEECWRCNPDGAGILYVVDGEIKMFKSMELKSFLFEVFTVHRKYNKQTPMILHFRIGTSGERTLLNVHPFYANEEVGFVHNGVLFRPPQGSKLSDTHLFSTYLQELPKGFHHNKATMELIRSFAAGDKLVFLDKDCNIVYVNKEKGNVDNGIWYSNMSWRPTSAYYYNSNKKKSNTNFPNSSPIKDVELEDVINEMFKNEVAEIDRINKQINNLKNDAPYFGKCEWCGQEQVIVYPVNWDDQIEVSLDVECIEMMVRECEKTNEKVYHRGQEITRNHPMFEGKFTDIEVVDSRSNFGDRMDNVETEEDILASMYGGWGSEWMN